MRGGGGGTTTQRIRLVAQTINLTDSSFSSISDEADVMDFYKHINVLQERLEQRSTEFCAGQIRHCLSQWEDITDDKEILNMVKGLDIDFCETSGVCGAGAFFT